MNVARIVALALGLVELAAAQGGDADLHFARIQVHETQPRCFASTRSPAFEDRLTEGQVVKVGPAQGDFRVVVLPTGVTGYVHKKFTTEPADGKVIANAPDVSFRYRPQSSEAPAQLLPKDTELSWLGEKDDWWIVRYQGAPAYLPATDVQVFDQPNDTLEKAWAELEQTRRGDLDKAVQARVAAEAAAEAQRQHEQKLAELAKRFRDAAAVPIEKQDFSAIETDLTAFTGELAQDDPVRPQAEALAKEIERQRLLARAIAVVQEDPPTVDRAAEILEPKVVDPLSRFDAVGWLRYETPLGGVPHFVLEKGGQTLFELDCSSGRYDLRVFDGVEVGVNGAKSRPTSDAIRSLDVLRLEVLQLPR